MFNKKIKTVFLGIIVLFLLAILVFALKSKNKNVDVGNNKNKNIQAENGATKAKEDENLSKILKELKNNHPQFSAEQLEFYRQIANSEEKEIFTCLGRKDEKRLCRVCGFY